MDPTMPTLLDQSSDPRGCGPFSHDAVLKEHTPLRIQGLEVSSVKNSDSTMHLKQKSKNDGVDSEWALNVDAPHGDRVTYADENAMKEHVDGARVPIADPAAREDLCLSSVATSAFARNSALSSPKCFDYLLSHKGFHSLHGSVVGQIALSLHDNLELRGHAGWFDVDSLTRVSLDSLRQVVSECRCLIILINEETYDSEWCLNEWTCAAELGLPMRVVVDLERTDKRVALDKAMTLPPHVKAALLQYQWIELVQSRRREVLEELSEFLCVICNEANERKQSLVHNDGSPVLHKSFDILVVLSGTPYWTPEGKLGIWCKTISLLKLWCLLLCILRFIYATGPAFVDHSSCLTFVVMHVATLFMNRQLNCVLREHFVKQLIASMQNETAQHRCKQLYAISKYYAIFAGFIACVGTLWIYTWTLPLFWHSDYLASPQVFPRIFGITSGIALILAVPSYGMGVCSCGVVVFALLFLITIQFEAAFDFLHPAIANTGVIKYATAVPSGISIQQQHIVCFNVRWTAAMRDYKQIQSMMILPSLPISVFWVLGLSLPSTYYFNQFGFLSLHWASRLRMLGMSLCAVLGIVLAIIPLMYATVSLRQIVDCGRQIVCKDPSHSELILNLMGIDLDCRLACLPVNVRTVFLAFAICLISQLPWLLIL